MPAKCACSRPVHDAVICRTCTDDLGAALATAADIWDDLQSAISRQTRMGEHAIVRSGRSTVLPWDDSASVAASSLARTLSRWATEIAGEDSAIPATTPSVATWLRKRTAAIRQHEAAAACVDEITGAVSRAMAVIDLKPGRQYAGPCGTCSTPLYVKPGATEVHCSRHDPTWSSTVAERQAWMLGEAASVLIHAAAVSHLLSLLGQRATSVQITRWVASGRLVPRGKDRNGRQTYRMGDVLDLIGTPNGKAS